MLKPKAFSYVPVTLALLTLTVFPVHAAINLPQQFDSFNYVFIEKKVQTIDDVDIKEVKPPLPNLAFVSIIYNNVFSISYTVAIFVA